MRHAVGIISRLIVYICFALIIGDAVVVEWRHHNYLLSVLALVFFPVTVFLWPLAHIGSNVFGIKVWLVFAIALVAYPISTFIGKMPPIEGVVRRNYN